MAKDIVGSTLKDAHEAVGGIAKDFVGSTLKDAQDAVGGQILPDTAAKLTNMVDKASELANISTIPDAAAALGGIGGVASGLSEKIRAPAFEIETDPTSSLHRLQ
jgi:hypothetical protein